jgi:hypothetical protein
MSSQSSSAPARLAGIRALVSESELSDAIAAAFRGAGAEVTVTQVDEEGAIGAAGKIDVAVINTAFEWQHDVPDDSDVTVLEEAFRRRVEGAFHLSQAIAARMNDGGSIIITAPMRYSHPVEPVRALVATSPALANLTASLAQALAKRRIRVNAVIPGPINTPRALARLRPEAAKAFGRETLHGKPARPEDIAPVYVFLAAAAEAGFINGATLEVTGGATVLLPAME